LTWLGTLPGCDSSSAYGVSSDGSVVGMGRERFKGASCLSLDAGWRDARPQPDLRQPAEGRLDSYHARAISPDGRYIVGWGYNASTRRKEAYLLDTRRTGDVNGDGRVDDADLLIGLFNFGCRN